VALSSTVFEEGDADRMLAEIVRVTRPGGRIGIGTVDMPFWVNLPSGAEGKSRRPQRDRRRGRAERRRRC
jgi:hypothetical protein